MRERVLVAMSGGVDSSVAAYLLKEQGYDVVGVTFQLYDYSRLNRKEGKGGCCSLEDVNDAKWVCNKLGIPHYLMDSRERFQQRVIDYFASSYKAGKTPNPCVACNTFIKFDELAHYADLVGAKYFATGHYVRIRREAVNDREDFWLETAKDPLKDQSYFLTGVDPRYLSRCLFPVGEFVKEEIRELAVKAGLPVSQKPDSMEVCFVPENNYRKFLQENYKLEDDPGDIVDEEGHFLGKHPGIHHFTVGQKKGLGPLGLHYYYVVKLDAEKKQVIVGEDKSLFSEGMILDGLYFRKSEEFLNRPLSVRIRSRASLIPATIVHEENGQMTAQFSDPQRAVTPGQFAVFYDGTRVVGGGPIVRAIQTFQRDGQETSSKVNKTHVA